MKKFLIYLTSIVTVVCLGLITYYFIKIDEKISIETKEIYCNVGDVIPVDSLGVKFVRPTNKTTFDYTTGVDEIVYDADVKSYVAKSAGEVEIFVKTSNRKYKSFKIVVHVGDGVNVPYYIKNEEQLSKIAPQPDGYGLDKSYKLLTNIVLSDAFQGVGTDNDGFSGIFDGNGYSISGLKITTNRANAGLFSRLETGATIKNLTISDAVINGEFDNAGVLAGICNGNVVNVRIKNSTIENSNSTAVIGGLVGSAEGANIIGVGVDGVNIKSSATATTDSYVGGLVGVVDGESRETIVRACYVNGSSLDLNSDITSGGLVAIFRVGVKNSSIQQSYANVENLSTNQTRYGAFLGEFKVDSSVAQIKTDDTDASSEYEDLMLKYLIGNSAVVGKSGFVDSDIVAIDDFYTAGSGANFKYLDSNNGVYYIAGFASSDDMIACSYDARYSVITANYIYYEIKGERAYWDTTYVWETHANALPTLRDNANIALQPTGDYYRKNVVDPTQPDPNNPGQPINPNLPPIDTSTGENILNFVDDIDISNMDWTPTDLTDTTIDGYGHTLTMRVAKTVDNYAGLYKTMNNSTIKNLRIVVKGISAEDAEYLGIVAARMINNSSVQNVTIDFENCTVGELRCTNFGGVVGYSEFSTINKVTIQKLNISENAKVSNIASLVADNVGSRVENSHVVDSVVFGSVNAAGLVVKNIEKSSISPVIANIDGNFEVFGNGSNIAGLVVDNYGLVDSVNVTVSVTSTSRNGVQSVAGGIVYNNPGARFAFSTLNGEKVSVENYGTNLYDTVKVGGLVTTNSGEIAEVNNYIKSIGNYYAGYNIKVGGIAEENFGSIGHVVMASNLTGNYVGGLAVDMKSGEAHINEVLIGNYNTTTRAKTRNTISGDKYVAGMVVDFRSGLVENVQAYSKLDGKATNARVSLIVLAFPNGANLVNSTVSSEISGYGTFYRDTWCDYSASADQFAGINGAESYASYFNLYRENSNHGRMQSVVIDSSTSGYSKVTSYSGTSAVFGIASSYDNNNDSSFVKIVNGFTSSSEFQGSFKFVTSSGFMAKCEYERSLTFNIGGPWVVSGNGIDLSFLSNI